MSDFFSHQSSSEDQGMRPRSQTASDRDYDSVRTTAHGAHIQILFGDRCIHALNLTHHHPDNIQSVGALDDPNGGILINTRILSAFLGLTSNTINTKLCQHGFIRDPQCSVTSVDPHLRNNAVGGHWARWRNLMLPQFGHSSTQSDAETLATYARDSRRPANEVRPVENWMDMM
jgi:hypothetical protein